MNTGTTEIFVFFGFLLILIATYWIYHTFYKGQLPPMLRKDEIAEEWTKIITLEKHGLRPTESSQKSRWFGLFRRTVDEFEPKEALDE